MSLSHGRHIIQGKLTKEISPLNFKEFHVIYPALIDLESQCRANKVEALYSGSPGVDSKHVAFFITHDLEYMRVAADEDVRPVGVYQSAGPGVVSSGVSADVGHQYFQPFAFEDAVHGVDEPQLMIVAVARYALQGLESCYFFGQCHAASEVTRMPYFIDRFEEFTEGGVKYAMGV